MNPFLNKNDIFADQYRVQHFISGDNNTQKYLSTGKDQRNYTLKVHDSTKIHHLNFHNKKLYEVEILGSLDSDGIEKLIDFGESVIHGRKFHYLVFKIISGESLYEKISREGVFSPYLARPIIIDLLQELALLHNAPNNVIHNNINLETISLDYSKGAGYPVITGFEYARFFTDTSNSVDINNLSLFHSAPELANGVFTQQSDVFSVGAVLYHMIFGTPPWHTELNRFNRTDEDLLEQLHKARMSPLSFTNNYSETLPDNALVHSLTTALSLDSTDRFSSVNQFIDSLQQDVSVEINTDKKKTPTLHEKKEGSGFDQIAGMNELKQLLHTDVIRALNEHELYDEYGLTIPNGMLLYGPPGCGKTFFSERFAEEVGFNMMILKPSDIKSRYINATEEKINEIFSQAAKNAPTIVFIDEFDAVAPSRESDIHEMQSSSVNELLAQMTNCSERGIFVIAATNRPEKIDTAVLRTGRIDRLIYVPTPDKEARESMLRLYLESRPLDLAVNFEEIAEKTKNYVSSDIKFIVDEASRAALVKKERITQEIILKVIEANPPSVSISEISKYEKLRDEFEQRSKEKKKRRIGFI